MKRCPVVSKEVEEENKISGLLGFTDESRVRNPFLTLDQVTRSFVASPKFRSTGWSITSSGISRLFASEKKKDKNKGRRRYELKKRDSHSIKAQQGLHPDVSRRREIYDSRSGITPAARSRACWVTLWKKKSNVSMKRCCAPGAAVRTSLL